ncbi:MAG: hypothetical protein HY874_09560 [Chloroflexi bacterium]|nr:hypothetical protein [Chloroflexota bacterium]
MKAWRPWLIVPLLLVVLFRPGTQTHVEAAGPMFGNGSDGAIIFSSNSTMMPIDAPASGTAGATTLTASNAFFAAGQRLLVHQTMGASAGVWELNQVAAYAFGTITTVTPLAHSYSSAGVNKAQVLVLPQYSNVTVNLGVILSAKPWSTSSGTGGILAFLASGTTTINGTISVVGSDGLDGAAGSGAGFAGGNSAPSSTQAGSGEGTSGPSAPQTVPNGNGGGGGATAGGSGVGGGGGNGSAGVSGIGCSAGTGGTGGSAAGSADLTNMVLGGGGGGGRPFNASARGGGAGGGIIVVGSNIIQGTGLVKADGGLGPNNGCASAGGGAGGSILLRGGTLSLTGFSVSAIGGPGGRPPDCGVVLCGDGGDGRVRVEYCDSLVGGASNPVPLVAHISCTSVGGIAEQPDVTALSTAAASSGGDSAVYMLGAAGALMVAAAGAVGWRKWRTRAPLAG